jgi:hypothetical protein
MAARASAQLANWDMSVATTIRFILDMISFLSKVSRFFYGPVIQFSGFFGLTGFFLEWQDSADINPVVCRVKIEIYHLNTVAYDCNNARFLL